MKSFTTILVIAASAYPIWARGQNSLQNTASQQAIGWQHCSALSDNTARLHCFDQWAQQQAREPGSSPAASVSWSASKPVAAPTTPVTAATAAAQTAPAALVQISMEAPAAHDCRNPQFSEMSRFWELEAGSDCGTFGIRGYKPINLSWVGANSVNTQPNSPSPAHTASSSTPYSQQEARIQLSVRTKIAQSLLTQGQGTRRDSLWFGYSQQSDWQLFSPAISRPFRNTDHEPEMIYVYPVDLTLPGQWRWRYAGWSLNHQSNGQSLPLSRSWNRSIVMAGFEHGDTLRLQARWWQRIHEPLESDDNPDIADLVGRAELAGSWQMSKRNTLSLTLRHSLRAQANGSARLEWLYQLGDDLGRQRSGLRFHTQLFAGYGDSLIDYNRRRTWLGVGLSLVDW